MDTYTKAIRNVLSAMNGQLNTKQAADLSQTLTKSIRNNADRKELELLLEENKEAVAMTDEPELSAIFAVACCYAGNYSLAASHIPKHIRPVRFYEAQGLLSLVQGDFRSARQYLEHSRHSSVESALAYSQLLYEAGERQADTHMFILSHGLQANDSLSVQLGCIYFNLQKYNDARLCFEEAVGLNDSKENNLLLLRAMYKNGEISLKDNRGMSSVENYIKTYSADSSKADVIKSLKQKQPMDFPVIRLSDNLPGLIADILYVNL